MYIDVLTLCSICRFSSLHIQYVKLWCICIKSLELMSVYCHRMKCLHMNNTGYGDNNAVYLQILITQLGQAAWQGEVTFGRWLFFSWAATGVKWLQCSHCLPVDQYSSQLSLNNVHWITLLYTFREDSNNHYVNACLLCLSATYITHCYSKCPVIAFHHKMRKMDA